MIRSSVLRRPCMFICCTNNVKALVLSFPALGEWYMFTHSLNKKHINSFLFLGRGAWGCSVAYILHKNINRHLNLSTAGLILFIIIWDIILKIQCLIPSDPCLFLFIIVIHRIIDSFPRISN